MDNEILVVAVGGFFLFVMLPTIMSIAAYQEKKLKLQRELARAGGEEVQVELAKTLAELARLRERMAVLERLVTDDDRRLAGEIERLGRDQSSPRA